MVVLLCIRNGNVDGLLTVNLDGGAGGHRLTDVIVGCLACEGGVLIRPLKIAHK